jgi:hypothetical protein
MFQLKPLSREAIPGALSKAERYRLLGEPWQAESICRDILAIDEGNQAATTMLILALTEQFDTGISTQLAVDAIEHLTDEYDRAYYSGIVHERRAIALFRDSEFRSAQAVATLLHHAMQWYDRAHGLRAAPNDDALLRWNACVRFLTAHPQLNHLDDKAEPAVLSQ